MFAKACRCDTCKCADNIIGPHNLHCGTNEGSAVLRAIAELQYKDSELFDTLAGPHGYAVYRAMLAQGHPTALNECCDTCALISKVFGYIPTEGEYNSTEWLYMRLKQEFGQEAFHDFVSKLNEWVKHENGEFLLRVMKAQNHPIASFIEKVLKNRAADEVKSSAAL